MSEKVPPRRRSRAAPFKPQASEVDKPYETDASQIAPPEPGPSISRGPALLDLKIHWAAMSASQKLRAKQAGFAATVAVLGYGLYTASGSSSADQPVITAASKLDMGAGLRGDSLETKLRGDVRKILDGQTLLGDRITAIEEGKVMPGSKPPGSLPDGDNLPSALPGSAPAFQTLRAMPNWTARWAIFRLLPHQ